MQKTPEDFGNQDLALLYIAKRLKEALAIEKVLTDAGVDYLVEPDTYRGGIIFASERVGAFFYVPQEALDSAQDLLRQHGYKPNVEAP